MNIIKRISLLVCLCSSLLMSISFTAHAEQMKKLGDWNVHYIALGSTFLTPEIAKAYGIVRSKYNGMVNISVLKANAGHTAQNVNIRGTARNLIGHQKKLQFKEVVEGKAIYYIAQIDYDNEETFKFEVTIQQGSTSHDLTFSQQFFAD